VLVPTDFFFPPHTNAHIHIFFRTSVSHIIKMNVQVVHKCSIPCLFVKFKNVINDSELLPVKPKRSKNQKFTGSCLVRKVYRRCGSEISRTSPGKTARTRTHTHTHTHTHFYINTHTDTQTHRHTRNTQTHANLPTHT